MKAENSMDFINETSSTTIISGALGHGLKRNEPQEQDMKKCYRCGRLLPKTAFNKNCRAKDGLQGECRECHAETMKAYHIKKAEELKALKVPSSSEKTMEHKPQEMDHKLTKVYAHAGLSSFTPRQMMEELKARGFRWEYMLEPQRKIYFEKI